MTDRPVCIVKHLTIECIVQWLAILLEQDPDVRRFIPSMSTHLLFADCFFPVDSPGAGTNCGPHWEVFSGQGGELAES